jgi:hypothetical protein
MIKVRAYLNIEVLVTCPHCEELLNILEPEDTNDTWHNDDNAVLAQAFPTGAWIEAHKNFEFNNVTCGKCKKDFNIKGLD